MSESRDRRKCLAMSALAGLCLLVAGAAAASEELSRREAELHRQYLDLERSFLRLADILATSDPRRAAVLRETFDRARAEEVGDRMGRIVELLEAGQLLKAGAGQQTTVEQFRDLLGLLEEGGGDRSLSDTKQQVRQFLGRVTKLIARQRDIEGSTEAGGDSAELGDRQRKAADEAAELAGDLGRFADRIDDTSPGQEQPAAGKGEAAEGPQPGQPGEPPAGQGSKPDKQGRQAGESGEEEAGEKGEPSDGQSGGSESQPGGQGTEPGEAGGSGDEADSDDDPALAGDSEAARARRTRRRLQDAERKMREARDQLEDAKRREARAEQERAIEALETARAELEEILRQLREEEVERLLVQLETRLRQMLRTERQVRAAAEGLAANLAVGPRERELEAIRIGRQQEEVTADADRALALVRDDGSAVAVPEALLLVRDDSAQAAARLAKGDIGTATLGLVADVVTALEELVAAVEKSRREEEARQQAGGGPGGRPAEPGEQPLVDKLAELKMLRSLQLRVNARTQRFSQLLAEGAERADEPELIEALGRLAERQRAIAQAARDIVTGRTE
jgi:hypothetical protein